MTALDLTAHVGEERAHFQHAALQGGGRHFVVSVATFPRWFMTMWLRTRSQAYVIAVTVKRLVPGVSIYVRKVGFEDGQKVGMRDLRLPQYRTETGPFTRRPPSTTLRDQREPLSLRQPGKPGAPPRSSWDLPVDLPCSHTLQCRRG